MHLTSNVEPQKNLYEILGIDSNADDNAIKKAYRKKVLTCHPDKNPDNPNAAELFHEMTKAYSVLIDIEARKAYDEFLAKILENRPKSPQQYEYDFSKWSSADYESFKRHQYERQKSNYSTNNESKNNPNESNDEEDDPFYMMSVDIPDFSPSRYGLVSGVLFTALFSFAVLFSGVLADNLSRRLLLAFAAVLWSATSLSTAIS